MLQYGTSAPSPNVATDNTPYVSRLDPPAQASYRCETSGGLNSNASGHAWQALAGDPNPAKGVMLTELVEELLRDWNARLR
jgi:hypothetical protein